MHNLRLLFWSILLPIAPWETVSQTSPSHSSENKREHIFQLRRKNNTTDDHLNFTRSTKEDSNDAINASGSKTILPDFDRIIWPRLKNNLCPHMVPNIEMAKDKIFFLARQRVGFNRAYQNIFLKDRDVNNDVYQRFFDFHPPLSYYPKNDFDNTYLDDDDDNTYLQDDDTDGDKYIMAYLPLWKCANQQIRKGMRHTLRKAFPTAIEYLDFFLSLNPKMSRHSPCLVTAIRDPISHFLSGYNEIETRFRKIRHEHLSQLIFSRFQDGTTLRFEQFVMDFLSAPNIHPMENPLEVYPLTMPHVYLMSGILAELARYNATLTDYLPSIENITDVWPHFVSTTCPNVTFPNEFFEIEPTKSGSHRSSKDLNGYYEAAKMVWSEGGKTAQALCILHIMDYACFDKLDIPQLCLDVYSEKAVVDLLAPGVIPENTES